MPPEGSVSSGATAETSVASDGLLPVLPPCEFARLGRTRLKQLLWAEWLQKASSPAAILALAELPLVPVYCRQDLYVVSERVDFEPRLDGKLVVAEMKLVP